MKQKTKKKTPKNKMNCAFAKINNKLSEIKGKNQKKKIHKEKQGTQNTYNTNTLL